MAVFFGRKKATLINIIMRKAIALPALGFTLQPVVVLDD